jgi:hypothetical protein
MSEAKAELRKLIEIASEAVEKLFKHTGSVGPMYHGFTADTSFILPAPRTDKDTAVEIVRALFEERKVLRYVFFDEAWIVGAKEPASLMATMAFAKRHGVRNHPDRREVVMFCAEDQTTTVQAHRYILRPEHGKAKLSPLNWLDAGESEGRMIGLLRRVP